MRPPSLYCLSVLFESSAESCEGKFAHSLLHDISTGEDKSILRRDVKQTCSETKVSRSSTEAVSQMSVSLVTNFSSVHWLFMCWRQRKFPRSQLFRAHSCASGPPLLNPLLRDFVLQVSSRLQGFRNPFSRDDTKNSCEGDYI